MPITDKLHKITPAMVQAASIFVDSMSSQIRENVKSAENEGVMDPLVWVLDCSDEVGLLLARKWQEESVAVGIPAEKRPYAICRAVSYEKARAGFTRMGYLGVDVQIPAPRKEHIDVLAVTQGSILVVGLPRDPTYRDMFPRSGEILTVISEVLRKPAQDLLMQAIVEPVEKSKEGELIRAVAIPWLAIALEIQKDPNFLFQFVQNPRRFEEFIAATYERAGWPQVILTPRSGDGGRDVIATKPGIGSIRFLDQCRAYSPGRLVTHDDVRSMYGVLGLDPNATKAIITTTSDFQPGVFTSEQFKAVMPYRLELRNGPKLQKWLKEILESGPP